MKFGGGRNESSRKHRGIKKRKMGKERAKDENKDWCKGNDCGLVSDLRGMAEELTAKKGRVELRKDFLPTCVSPLGGLFGQFGGPFDPTTSHWYLFGAREYFVRNRDESREEREILT